MSSNLYITYQKATDSDMPQILSILKAVRGDTGDMYVDDFLIAKDEEKVVGCVRIKKLPEGTLELASLGVLDAYRGQGVGRNLLTELLRDDSRRSIYLLCMREKESFYQKFGFEIVQLDRLPPILQSEFERVSKKLADNGREIIAMVLK